MTATLCSGNVLTKQRKIAEVARRKRGEPLSSINHTMDLDWFTQAWKRTRKNGAVGIDDIDREAFEKDLAGNLEELAKQFRSGTYKAPPSKRVYIPKSDGGTRPIAIPCLGDKVLQRAVAMAMEPILESHFYSCSYGFRPNRSAYQACSAIRESLHQMGGGYVLEGDIQSFFDTISHQHLRNFLSEWITDGVIRKQIDKWLKAGILENETLTQPDEGSIQGGVISPCLANVYLHFVLDDWFHLVAVRHLKGPAKLIRYCDDFVIVCKYETDAIRLKEALVQRFARFNLKLHPDKTCITPFHRPLRNVTKTSPRLQKSWDFPGFTFIWSCSFKGKWIIKLRTSKKRFSKSLQNINEWCKRNRHKPIREQYKTLMQKIRGHQAYFRIIGNSARAAVFEYEALKIWRKWLNRRSWAGYIKLDEFCALLNRLKPLAPRIPPLANL